MVVAVILNLCSRQAKPNAKADEGERAREKTELAAGR